MALFTDVVYNKYTGKHELQFVNQQYDFLMGIVWDSKTSQYVFNVSDEEAEQIFQSWGGRAFNKEEWMKMAVEEIPKKDAAKAAEKNAGGPSHDN